MEALPDRQWTNLPDYPLCEVAAVRYQPARWAKAYRYVVKRQLTESKAGELVWQYHVCVTNDEVTPAYDLWRGGTSTMLIWRTASKNISAA